MRHRKASLKLNRTSSHRNAMFRNMVTSLFKYDRIRTTDTKAKQLRVWADRLITLAKRGDLHARRQALSIVREKDIVHKLFDEANERFGSIPGGYARIVKVGRRRGDAAPISIVELAALEKTKKKKVRKKKTTPVEKESATEERSAVEVKEDKTDIRTAEESPVEISEAEALEKTTEAADASESETEAIETQETEDKDAEKPAAGYEELKPDGSSEEESEKKTEEEPDK